MLHSKCQSKGSCSIADSKQTVYIEEGAPLVCPECQGRVNLVPHPETMSWSVFAVLLIVLLGGCWGMLSLLSRPAALPAGLVAQSVTTPAGMMHSGAPAGTRPVSGGAATGAKNTAATTGTPSSADKAGEPAIATANASPPAHGDASSAHSQPHPQGADANWKVPGNGP